MCLPLRLFRAVFHEDTRIDVAIYCFCIRYRLFVLLAFILLLSTLSDYLAFRPLNLFSAQLEGPV